jgi:hypothetical protein
VSAEILLDRAFSASSLAVSAGSLRRPSTGKIESRSFQKTSNRSAAVTFLRPASVAALIREQIVLRLTSERLDIIPHVSETIPHLRLDARLTAEPWERSFHPHLRAASRSTSAISA